MKNTQNKKIRNATICKSKGITFKSKLEKMAFNKLAEEGFDVKYEPQRIELWPGFTPQTPFYDAETDTQYEKRGAAGGKKLVPKKDKIIGLRYTPDLYIRYHDLDIWIEMKSIQNDVYYIKKKLFRKYLDDKESLTGQKSIFFEVHNKRQLLQAIEIFKDYQQQLSGNTQSDTNINH